MKSPVPLKGKQSLTVQEEVALERSKRTRLLTSRSIKARLGGTTELHKSLICKMSSSPTGMGRVLAEGKFQDEGGRN